MDIGIILTLGMIVNIANTTPLCEYNQYNDNIYGYNQCINTLEIDIANPNIYFENMLSHGTFFGFEKTSDIARNNKVYTAVNGTFFGGLGEPVGIFIRDKELHKLPIDITPVFAITYDKKAYIGDLSIEVYINDIKIDTINKTPKDNQTVLYTDIYGKTTRLDRDSVNYIIKDNIVIDIIKSDKPVNIQKDCILLTSVSKKDNPCNMYIGDICTIKKIYSEDIDIEQAFQTGGYLVRDGVNISKNIEVLQGLTTNREPRTVIGIKNNGNIFIATIDGRRKTSIGFTGYELAEYMISNECTCAAYLDGGASTTMYVYDDIVNEPSYKNKERIVAHSIGFKFNNDIYLGE